MLEISEYLGDQCKGHGRVAVVRVCLACLRVQQQSAKISSAHT